MSLPHGAVSYSVIVAYPGHTHLFFKVKFVRNLKSKNCVSLKFNRTEPDDTITLLNETTNDQFLRFTHFLHTYQHTFNTGRIYSISTDHNVHDLW